ncbi:MAG: redoxin domain-containing protein [Bacteroidetes bacterium]|nr:redoxin domain-containing protein [Bacteroidota bacterium]
MKIKFLIIFFLLFAINLHSQNVTIKGNAPSHAGDSLIFYTYSDLITYKEKKVCECKVCQNGDFLFKLEIENTKYIFAPLGVYKVVLFVEPDSTYEIVLPEKSKKSIPDKLNPFFEKSEYYVGIINKTPADLNFLIRDFDYIYEDYLAKNFYGIYHQSYNKEIDSLISSIDSLFSRYNNQYFVNYKKYKFAFLKFLSFQRDVKYVTKYYFSNQPLLYNNIAYMDLFNQLYQNFFSDYINTKEGERLFSDIAYAKSPFYIKKTLDNNLAFANDDNLKDLVILKGLLDAFSNNDFPSSSLFYTLDSVKISTNINENKIIATNIKKEVTQLRSGFNAPKFELYNSDSVLKNLNNYKGKYVYLNFITTLSFTCKQDLELLKKLDEEKDDKLVILTISIEDNFSDCIKYFKENAYDWDLLHVGNQPDVLKKYKIKTTPMYYLINPSGKLSMCPAYSPREHFEHYFSKMIRLRN